MVCSLLLCILPLQRYVFEYGHKHCAPPTRTKIDALIAFVEEKEATVRANPKGEQHLPRCFGLMLAAEATPVLMCS